MEGQTIPAVDNCEPQVIRALEKAGWRVIGKPFTLRIREHDFFADLQLERIEDSANQIIVVEVKCFSDENAVAHDLQQAIGHYITYRAVLKI